MYDNMSTRLWVIGAGILTVAIVAMGWFLGVSPKLGEAATADQQRAEVAAQNVGHERETAKIKKQYEQLPELKAQLAVLRAAIPAGDDLSTFLGELHQLEQQNQVSLTSFAAGDGRPYTPPVSPAATDAKAAAEATAGTAATASETASAKDTAAPGATSPLVTADNFVAIPVTVIVTGSHQQAMNFIQGLQSGSRLFLVTDLSMTQEKDSANYEAKITGFVYVLLDANASTAAPDKPAETTTAPKG